MSSETIRTFAEGTSVSYLEQIERIQEACEDLDINHRFVGGTLTDLINPGTKARFDFGIDIIRLNGYTSPKLYRSDGTVKDVDLISFAENPSDFRRAKRTLARIEKDAKEEGIRFPHVSIESTRFPDFPPRNPFLQLVSGFEVDEKGDLFLTYDRIRQKIDWETVSPWRVVLDDGTSFTTLNPFAHALRYSMRVPFGIKNKDREVKKENGLIYNKMSPYVDLALEFAERAEDRGINMTELYSPWIEFIARMRLDRSFQMKAKRLGTDLYWSSLGTALAHGRGLFSPFASLGDRFTG